MCLYENTLIAVYFFIEATYKWAERVALGVVVQQGDLRGRAKRFPGSLHLAQNVFLPSKIGARHRSAY